MALQKLTYTDGVTVIPASNLNDIQDAIIALENQQTSGVSDDLKTALLQLAQKVAYIDDQGQQYYDDLYDALYPPKTAVSIAAVFTQGSTVVYDNASLDSLKTMLQVTATYDDSSTEILADSAYTLSGTLTPGTSTVTVTYNSLTTTFTVNVTEAPTLSSISAVYTQSGTVYDTDTLDSLKADLVVTAHYSDSSTQTVPSADYTLSGTLTVGTSTITVSYGGKTTTFNVTVTEYAVPPLYNWDLTQSLTDTEQGLVVDTNGTFAEGTGLSFTADNMYADFGAYELDRTYELTIEALNRSNTTNYRRFLMTYKTNNTSTYGNGLVFSSSKGGVEFYTGSWQTAILQTSNIADLDGKWSVYTGADGKWKVYRNGVYIGQSTTAIAKNSDHTKMLVGSSSVDYTRVKITSFKVYEGEVIN